MASRHHQERIKSDVSEASFPFQAYPMFLFFFLKRKGKEMNREYAVST